MNEIFEKFKKKIAATEVKFVRNLMNEIDFSSRLIGIKGSRGVGKTTLLLQHISLNFTDNLEKVLYVSLDDIWFSDNRLVDLANYFIKRGGEYLFLDEVHKYPNWSQEIKNLYDDYTDLKIVFTGSSLLEILNSRADLSRRAIIYNMQGLSFREYLSLETGKPFDIIELDEILQNHEEITNEILKQIKPLIYFSHYLEYGYYPFYIESMKFYKQKISEIINLILEIELPQLRNLNVSYIHKIKQLLYIISESVPFTPNITKLSEKTKINRETLSNYLYYLNETNIIISAYKDKSGISLLQKPDKIYLENSNLMYAINPNNINLGNLRETFFINQLKYKHKVEISETSDFIVDRKYTFEIGGKNKNTKQIENIKNSFIAADDIEYGYHNKIPLWLFGFLY